MANIFLKKITADQERDAGLALLLILLLLVVLGKQDYLMLPAIVVLVSIMTWPVIFRPWGRLWFGLSHLLGTVMSKILLTVVFVLLVVPVGLARKFLGADAMHLKLWRKGDQSVFVKRDHTFTKEDMTKPY